MGGEPLFCWLNNPFREKKGKNHYLPTPGENELRAELKLKKPIEKSRQARTHFGPVGEECNSSSLAVESPMVLGAGGTKKSRNGGRKMGCKIWCVAKDNRPVGAGPWGGGH